MDQEKPEPFFGYNAKPWFITFACAFAGALVFKYWLGPIIRPYTDMVANFFLTALR